MSMVWVAVGTTVAAGAALGGAAMTSGAMEDAADQQTAAANRAADLQQQQYLRNRADLTPWRETGKGALAQLNYLMGLPEAKEEAALPGQTLVGGVPQTKYTIGGKDYYMVNPGGDYSAPGWKKMEQALAKQATGIPGALVTRIGSNTVLLAPAPAQETGGSRVKAAATGTGETPYWGTAGQLTKPFEFDQTDPSYAWRFKEGQEAVNQSAAAKGGYFSGETGLELERYGQGLASTEYGAEFNRHLTEQQNLYNMLAGISGTGQTTATAGANLGANAASNAGNIIMTGAANAGNLNAEAAKTMQSGYQGASNQLMSGAGTYLNYKQMQDLLAQLGGGGGYNFSLGGVPYTQ